MTRLNVLLAKGWFFPLALLLLVLLVYGRTLFFGYVFDDLILLEQNQMLVNAPLSWDLVARPVLEDTSYLRPLAFFTWWLEVQLTPKSNPMVSHGFQLIFFYLMGLQMWLLLRAFLKNHPRQALVAAGATVVYLLHPATAELVSWISDRFDLLANLFMLAALTLFFRFKGGFWRTGAILLCGGLALFSKETGILLIGFLLLMDLYEHFDHRQSWREQLRCCWQRNRGLYISLVIMNLAYLWLRGRYGSGMVNQPVDWAYIKEFYLEKQAPLLAWRAYLQLTFLPYLDNYFVDPLNNLSANRSFYLGSLFIDLVSLGAIAWAVAKRQRWSLLALAYGLGLVLVLHFIPMRVIDDSIKQNRFLPLSLTFVVMALAQLWLQRPLRRSLQMGAGLALVALLITAISHTNRWQNNQVFWEKINEEYVHYFNGRASVGYFNLLLQHKENLPYIKHYIELEEKLADEKMPLRHYLFISYADFLLKFYEDPESLRIMEQHIPYISGSQLMHTYAKYADGLLRLENNYRLADRYMERIREKSPYLWHTDLEIMRINLATKLLLDRPDEVRLGLQQLTKFTRMNSSDKSPQELFYRYVDERARQSCAKEPRDIPACAPDFSLEAYGRTLLTSP